MSRCPPIEKDGHYKTFGEVVQKLIDLTSQYGECAANHNALVEFLGQKNNGN